MKIELTRYQKQRIVDLHNKGLTRFQITKKLGVGSISVDKIIYRYITKKVYNGNKICSICRQPKPHTEEYFTKTGYITKEGNKVLRSDCKVCRSKLRKKQRKEGKLWLEYTKSLFKKRVKRLLGVYNYRYSLPIEKRKEINKNYSKIFCERKKQKRLQEIINKANEKRNNL